MNKFIRFAAVILFLIVSQTFGQKENFKIGFALRGGGALGFAHIGALEVIDSLGIPVSYISGTSMGGLVGALYSIGYSGKEIEKIILGIDWSDLFTDTPKRNKLPAIIRQNKEKFQLELEVKSLQPVLPSGLISGQKISQLFFKYTFPFESVGGFDNLPIPFRCVGADLVSGRELAFDKGSLAFAMRSTMSIPTVFNPVEYGEKLIVDGGVLNNYPTDIVKKMGADYVVGLNLVSNPKQKEYFDDLLKILDRTTDIPRMEKIDESEAIADLNINENIEGFSIQDFQEDKILRIIQRGRKAAYRVLPELLEIKHLSDSINAENNLKKIKDINISGNKYLSEKQILKILNLNNGSSFNIEKLKRRIARINKSGFLFSVNYDVRREKDGFSINLDVNEKMRPTIDKIHLSGNEFTTRKFILSLLNIKENSVFDLQKFQKKIDALFGLGYYSYLRYSIERSGENSINLRIDTKEKSNYNFQFGIRYNDYYRLVGIVGLRVYSTLAPGMYAELNLIFSGYEKLNLLLAYPSSSLSFPIYPFVKAEYKNIPWKIYDIQGNNVVDYRERAVSVSGGIGLGFFKELLFSGDITVEYPKILIDIANIPELKEKEIRDRILSYNLQFDYDDLDNALTPRNGFKILGAGQFSSKKLGSQFDYNLFSFDADYYHTISKIHTFTVGTTFRKSFHPEPIYKTSFHIGGPKTFVGWNYFQAFGPQFTILRAAYRLNFAGNFFIGLKANTAVSYEFYNGLSDSSKPLWGYGLSLEYKSILGPVKIIFGYGDKSPMAPGDKNGKVYFVAGYNF